MRKLIIIILLSLPIYLNAQCKEVVDKMTNKKTIANVIFIGGLLNIGNMISFSKEDDKKIISYMWTASNTIDNINKIENTSLLIKFTDGTLLRFLPNSDSEISSFNNSQIYILNAELKPEDITAFGTKSVDMARFALKGDNGVDLSLTAKNKKQFKEAMNCIE